jgi:CRISPR-associated protein Cmr3
MTRIGLRLDPLDTLFFRDGRPFDAATRASGQLPSPQPLAGAIRTALLAREGFGFAEFSARRKSAPQDSARAILEAMNAPRHVLDLRFRGPWLALANGDQIEPLLPVAVNLARDDEERWYRSDPLRDGLPGWRDPDGLRPLWRKEGRIAKHPGGFLTLEGVKLFLDGKEPKEDHWFSPDDLYGFDHRTGIEIDPHALTAADGKIYAISLLALRPNLEKKGAYHDREICLYAEVLADTTIDVSSPLPLGGEGRYVRIEPTKTPCSWPEPAKAERSVLLLATPAFLARGKSLPEVAPGMLVAAASGTPVAFSGWDIARGGPRPTRFAVPAGSVYFVEGSFTPPREESLCTDDEDKAQGWGYFLRGTWNYA